MQSSQILEQALRNVTLGAITASGIAFAEVARRAGMRTEALRDHLSGPGGFPVSALGKIARALGTTSSRLMEKAEANV